MAAKAGDPLEAIATKTHQQFLCPSCRCPFPLPSDVLDVQGVCLFGMTGLDVPAPTGPLWSQTTHSSAATAATGAGLHVCALAWLPERAISLTASLSPVCIRVLRFFPAKVMGDVFIRKYYSVFDMEGQGRMGFAPVKGKA